MSAFLFVLLLWFGIMAAAAGCVVEARDATRSHGTLAWLAVGAASITAAFAGALY